MSNMLLSTNIMRSRQSLGLQGEGSDDNKTNVMMAMRGALLVHDLPTEEGGCLRPIFLRSPPSCTWAEFGCSPSCMLKRVYRAENSVYAE
jgi:hypothetical protein